MRVNLSNTIASRRTIFALLLFALAALTILTRVGYLAGLGFRDDIQSFQEWIVAIQKHGLFDFYRVVAGRLYPPISTLVFGIVAWAQQTFVSGGNTLDNPAFVVLLKLPLVIAEVVLVVSVFVWLKDSKVPRWIIPFLLAIHPALITTSAWWGQNDALFTVFIVLALMMLNRDRPIAAWLLFGVAVLCKHKAILLTPMLVVLCFRRYGWKRLLVAMVAAGVVVLVVTLPFVAGSGLQRALSPFTEGANVFPAVSLNALDIWYPLAPLSRGIVLQNWLPTDIYYDYVPLLGPLTYRNIGYVMGGLIVLVVCKAMWTNYTRKAEFIWAATIYLAVFVMFTQIHER